MYHKVVQSILRLIKMLLVPNCLARWEVKHDTTINSNNLAVDISVLSKEHNAHRHLLILAWTSQWDVSLLLDLGLWELGLVVLIGLAMGGHLTVHLSAPCR